MRNPRFLLLFVVVCLATAASAQTVTDLVAAYEKTRLGDAKTVSNLTVAAGHGTYTLPSGTATVVLAGDKPVGLFLTGSGTFRYETTNKDEFPVLRYNAKNGGFKIDAGPDKVVVQDSFTSALLLGNGLPETTGGAAAAPQGAFDVHRALFERSHFYLAPPDQLLAYQALDNPTARIVYAQVGGGKFPFIHDYDDAYANDETLQILLGQGPVLGRFSDTIYPVLLSRQAIGRGDRDIPAIRALLTDVDVNLVGQMNEQGTMTVTETIVPQKRPMKALRFDLLQTLFMETKGRDRHFNLKSVTDEQGRTLPFVHQYGELLVGFPEPVPAGKAVKLKFEIDGNFLYRQDKTNYWELGIEPWFPWLRLHEQAFRFHALIKVEKPFVVFASGKTIRRGEEGSYNVVETRLDNPVDYVAILAGKYQFSEEVRNGVMIRVASFISKNEEMHRKLRMVAASAIDYFPFFLGPFPFDEINVIEKDSQGEFAYGQAPAGIVFITSEAFKPMNPDVNDMIIGVNARFAHELAHMYFANQVRRPTAEEQWLDEAFAEYAGTLFMKAGKKGEDDYRRAFNRWRDKAKDVAADGTIPMANRLDNRGSRYEEALSRQHLIYDKGAYLLAALHKELGDEMFLTFLKSYQRSFRWKSASTKDVIGLLAFVTKKDYAPFFEKYYYGTEMPDVKLK